MSRRLTIFACLALGAAPSLAVAQDKSQGTEDRPIVITGKRVSDLKKDLAACIARKCSPDQEIDAALAIAEDQFVSGSYRDARSTTLAAIDRNKRYAKVYPVAVADLLRANYRIAAHLGDGESFRIGTFDTLSALRAGLPDDDPRVLGGELEIGDMYVHFARIDEAINQYAGIQRRAEKLGLSTVAGRARLRIVALYVLLAEKRPELYGDAARRNASMLIDNTDPRMKPFGQAASVLVARMDAKGGDAAAVDRLIAEARAMGSTTRPVLLYAPSLDEDATGRRGLPTDSTINRTASRVNYDDEWVDIGFWITPEGKVTDAEVLRGGKGPQTPDWAKPILGSIGGRRYAPLKLDAGQTGLQRVERFTFVARIADVTGTRLPGREPSAGIESLDLSVDPPAAPKSGG